LRRTPTASSGELKNGEIMNLFRRPLELKTEPTRLECMQAELRELQKLGSEQEAGIDRLQQRDEIDFLQAQRESTRRLEQQLQANIEADLYAESDRQAVADATAEKSAAREAVNEASALCAKLDDERRSWQRRRDEAYRAFCFACERHEVAKQRLAELSQTPDASGLAN
jgi:hypothetical protein